VHVREWGQGDRIAILLQGMMGSSDSWWRVTRSLVDRGYRVLAMDLPGHGHSPRDPGLTTEKAVTAVVTTDAARSGFAPALAIGHSFGGLVLAAALPDLRPEHAVIVDAPTSSRGACADNSAMEPFFSLPQKNVLNKKRRNSRQELRLEIVTWIERTYPLRRRQRRLGRLTPIEFEIFNSQAAHSA
jgi:pimeloyl-ACP methyl ester carboxylesterase